MATDSLGMLMMSGGGKEPPMRDEHSLMLIDAGGVLVACGLLGESNVSIT